MIKSILCILFLLSHVLLFLRRHDRGIPSTSSTDFFGNAINFIIVVSIPIALSYITFSTHCALFVVFDYPLPSLPHSPQTFLGFKSFKMYGSITSEMSLLLFAQIHSTISAPSFAAHDISNQSLDKPENLHVLEGSTLGTTADISNFDQRDLVQPIMVGRQDTVGIL